MLTKQPVFEARTRGYKTYRIPGLLVTKRGTVLATAEARRGDGGDYDNNDVLLRRSTDGGLTWEEPQLVVSHTQYGPGPVSNFVMLQDQDSEEIHALYCHDYSRVFHMVSEDEGGSFSTPVEITAVFEEFRKDYPWQVIAAGPGHGLQLRSGRFIIPVWMSDGSGTEFGPGHRGHRPSCVGVVYSDDRGKSWERGDIVVPQDFVKNPSETIAVELSDGSVMLNIRTESDVHRRLVSVSPDGISNWSEPHFDEALLEPICMASIIRHSWPTDDKPGVIVFANPSNLERTMAKWACDRKRLSIKLSYDEGKTWPANRVLEEGPSGYSDLAVLPDGTILCLYECGIVERMGDDKYLMLARFDLDWARGEEGA